MQTTLYDISDRYTGFMALVASGEIEDQQAITDTLDSIQQEFDQKVDNIACLYKSLSAEADAIETEAKRLLDRVKYKRKLCERLKSYVSGFMQQIGLDKFENQRNKVFFRRSKSLEITDENALLVSLSACDKLNLIDVATEIRFDKVAIKKEISSGTELNGAFITETKNLQIK